MILSFQINEMESENTSDGEEFNELVFHFISFLSQNNLQNREKDRSLAGSSRRSRPKMTPILLACIILAALREVRAISSSWRPIVPGHADGAGILHQEASIFENAPTQTLYEDSPHHLLLPNDRETCSLYKVSMSQQLYFEVGSPGAAMDFCIVNRISRVLDIFVEFYSFTRRSKLEKVER